MSKQYLSIEQMQHLQELGVDTSKASIILIASDYNDDIVEWDEIISYEDDEISFEYFDAETGNYDHSYRKYCGVFTLQDILDLLPKTINKEEILIGWSQKGGWCIDYFGISPTIRNEHLIEAAYEMLCWCLENGFIDINNK